VDMLIYALPVLLLLNAGAEEPKWEASTQDDGLTILSREKPGTGVHEMKASGFIDAPPMAVWKALRDYAHYTETMPYTEKAEIIAREPNDKVIWFHSVINAPFVSRRDYVIKITDETDYKDPKGIMKVSWTNSTDKTIPPVEGVVRVTINDGYWILQPMNGGKTTYATYYVYTDPGGSLPKWVVNKANSKAVPDVFNAVRKEAKKYQG
jgi:hypothetical protein